MSRTLRLTNGNDNFTQGFQPRNVAITLITLGGKDNVVLNNDADLGGRNRVDTGSGKDAVLTLKEDGNLIRLGTGDDTMVGRGFSSFSAERADTVEGGAGDDVFAFETFKSLYKGGSGNDIFHSVGWQNTIHGGSGQDTVSYAPRTDDATQGDTGVTINLATQRVQTGANRVETLISIEHASGSDNDDVLLGNGLANRLHGAGGLDALSGGGGADRFIYRKLSDARVFNDIAEEIVDFNRTQGDQIDLSALDANTQRKGNQAFRFTDDDGFTGTAGQLRAIANTPDQMLVQGDVNGDGRADFQFLVSGLSALQATDFIL